MHHLLPLSAQLLAQWERRWSDIITTDLRVIGARLEISWYHWAWCQLWTLTEMLLLVVSSQAGLVWRMERLMRSDTRRGVRSAGEGRDRQWRRCWSCPRILSLATCSVNISALLLHTTIAPRSVIMFVCPDHSSQLCKTPSRCLSW